MKYDGLTAGQESVGFRGIEARELESEHTISDFEAHSYSTQRKIGKI